MATHDEIARLKKTLGLQAHPSGFGCLAEKWRSEREVTFVQPTSHGGARSASSTVYFMLQGKDFINWHLQLSDEFFFWHAGGVLKVHLIDQDGNYSYHVLGDTLNNPEYEYCVVVPHDNWYAAEMIHDSPYVLYSAALAPGWELHDWFEGKKEDLVKKFPQHKEKFERLCGPDA